MVAPLSGSPSSGGIGIVVNPRSRRNLKDPRAATRLARALGDHGVVRTANSHDDVARIAEDFRKLKIGVLGISGGDGTNHVTITGFLRAYQSEDLPPLAFLRGGTMNTVANAVGVPRGRPEGLLARLIDRTIARKHPLCWVERHVMRIGNDCGFLFGTGAIHGFISEYNRAEDKNPLWAAEVLLRATAQVMAGEPSPVAERWQGKVTFPDGSAFAERDYLAIGAGTIDQIGLGFRPYYRFGEQPGTFHMLGIHTTATGFVRRLPEVWFGRSMGEDHAFEKVVSTAVVEARCGVVRYMCDGDLHEHKGPLTIETGPRVRILVEDTFARTAWRPTERRPAA